MSARSVRSRAKVISLDTDFTSSSTSTGDSSAPAARARIMGPFLPNTRRKSPSSAAAISPKVRTPRAVRAASAAGPTPLKVRTGRGPRNAASPPG